MRFLGLTAFAVLFAAGLSIIGPAGAVGPDAPDGATAHLTTGMGTANLVLTPDANGDYVIYATLYEKVGGAWQIARINAALRVFTWGDHASSVTATQDVPNSVALSADGSVNAGWSDRVLIPFTSTGANVLKVPASALKSDVSTPRAVDIFVTFSALGTSDHTPTSHWNVARNQVIGRGEFDTADTMDVFGTQFPVVSVA